MIDHLSLLFTLIAIILFNGYNYIIIYIYNNYYNLFSNYHRSGLPDHPYQ